MNQLDEKYRCVQVLHEKHHEPFESFEIVNAMIKYGIIKMIEENQSIIEMAKLHMDSRSVIIIQDRIIALETRLNK